MPLVKLDAKQGSALVQRQERLRDETEHANGLRADAELAAARAKHSGINKTTPSSSSRLRHVSPISRTAANEKDREKQKRATERLLSEMALKEALIEHRGGTGGHRDADEDCRDEQYRDEDDDDGEEKAFVDD